MFHVNAKLANPSQPGRTAEVSLLVDTGATLSWIPRKIIEELGIRPETHFAFTVADGREMIRPVGPVKMTMENRSLTLPVAFCEPGEEAVLGGTALEVLGFGVDPLEMKLAPRKHLALLREL
ncbi:MAG: retroviral-like aspartic protease family protein [Acidobacteria bacterium]|nr:retroviral-like aspartic protease family protein [Acidobacteriota bacterium]